MDDARLTITIMLLLCMVIFSAYRIGWRKGVDDTMEFCKKYHIYFMTGKEIEAAKMQEGEDGMQKNQK